MSQSLPATYNVNGKSPRDEKGDLVDLKPWLLLAPDSMPDIYAIGYLICHLDGDAIC